LKRLDREPAKFEFKGAAGEKPQTITLSRGAYVTNLRVLLYQPGIVSRLPYVLHRAYENDWSPFAGFIVATHRAVGDQVTRGLAYSVICSESIPFISESDIRLETAGTYLGDFDVRRNQKKCAVWAQAAVNKDILEPVRSDVPVLLIAGEEDPATPTWLAERAAKSLSHGRVVSIPNGTHLTSAECTDNLIAQFIRAGSEKGIDVGCVSQIRRPAFVSGQ
jgi:pimeloyl-ACP methyl ester carboxylesterase